MTDQRFTATVPDNGDWRRQITCKDACPAHTDARGYVCAIADGDLQRADIIARGPNPFASICGRVCAAPCEVAGRRGDIDAPVVIRALKCFVTERHDVEAPLRADQARPPAEACTLCGACAGPCPTQALRLDEAEGTVRLIYDHGRCVPCGACASRCPEHILTVGRALDLGLLAAGVRVVASDRVLRCRSCGSDLGPARLVRQASAARSGPSGAEDLCGICRIKGSLWAARRQSRASGGDVSGGTGPRISK